MIPCKYQLCICSFELIPFTIGHKLGSLEYPLKVNSKKTYLLCLQQNPSNLSPKHHTTEMLGNHEQE